MLPSEFGELTQLALLRLGNAALIGTVPTETGLLRDLTELGIYNIQLSGTLFSELVFLTSLTKLDVSGNHFVGTVFSELGFLTDLTSLSLRSNHFSGTIFTEIGLLISLEWFLFDSNQFSGELPTELGNLPTGYCKWRRLLLFVNFTGTYTCLFPSILTITGCKQIYQYLIRAWQELFRPKYARQRDNLIMVHHCCVLAKWIVLIKVGTESTMCCSSSILLVPALTCFSVTVACYWVYSDLSAFNTSLSGTVPADTCKTAKYLSYGAPLLGTCNRNCFE